MTMTIYYLPDTIYTSLLYCLSSLLKLSSAEQGLLFVFTTAVSLKLGT
jgi:hypothetical protein